MGIERNPEQKKKSRKSHGAVFSILLSLSAAHFLNDALQMLIPAIYPLLKANYNLSFTQIGVITLVFQLMASIFQPLVGNYTDKKPLPYSLAIGMCFTLVGLLALSFSGSFAVVLVSVAFVGLGSSIFHPESSRMTRYASGNRAGMGQSIFQVGGRAGTAIGPLMAAAIIIPFGQHSIALFTILVLIAIFILWKIGNWYKEQNIKEKKPSDLGMQNISHVSKKKVALATGILMILIFSKFFYLSSMKNYFTFYLIDHFGLSVQSSQIYLFVFFISAAVGALVGGRLADIYGRKKVIWFSILGVAPFTILLPYANFTWTIILIVVIGVIISSAFPTIIVYGQELIPEKLGMVSGLFYGFAFGMGAIGAALLGILADKTSIYYMFEVVSFLPLLGLFAVFLPNLEKHSKRKLKHKIDTKIHP